MHLTKHPQTAFFVSVILGLMMSPAYGQLPDGLYAVFDTNMGSFTARLDYVSTPRTVANFVGLAEGTQPWIDEETGTVRTESFYDGTIVIRIADIPERIVQMGSRNGTNSGGGPGYTFPDEFHSLSLHDQAGVLSMANSGLNSNGSQVFFTLGPLPGLDGRHTVFGLVVDGLGVLEAIGDLPLAEGQIKPDPPVVFEHISMLRIGAAAQAFDPASQGVPLPRGVESSIQPQADGTLAVGFERRAQSVFKLYRSSDLALWDLARSELHVGLPPTDPVPVMSDEFRAFHKVASVDYPGDLYTPASVSGGLFNCSDGLVEIQLGEDATSGVVTLRIGEDTFVGFILYRTWRQAPYRGMLYVLYSGFTPPAMDLEFAFTGPGGGHYKGELLGGSVPAAFSGAFVYTPPAE